MENVFASRGDDPVQRESHVTLYQLEILIDAVVIEQLCKVELEQAVEQQKGRDGRGRE